MANLSKSLADVLHQPTSFPTARSNKKNPKNPSKAQNAIKPKIPSGLGFFSKTQSFSEACLAVHAFCYDLCEILQCNL